MSKRRIRGISEASAPFEPASPVLAAHALGNQDLQALARYQRKADAVQGGGTRGVIGPGEAGEGVTPAMNREDIIPSNDLLAMERILGRSDLVKVNYFHHALRAARAVCRILIRDRFGFPAGFGTGSLVGPNLLLTNNHVLSSAEDGSHSLAEFDYEEDEQFAMRPSRQFRLEPDRLFVTDQARDFTLIAIAPVAQDGTALADFGMLRLIEATGKAQVGEYVSIIQHPRGNTKHAALRENRVLWFDDDWMHYETDTEPGSSGSPVFNEQWFVVALHHAGVPKTDRRNRFLKKDGSLWRQGVDHPNDLAWIANEGLRVSRLFKALEDRAGSDAHAERALALLRANGTSPSAGPVVAGRTPGVAAQPIEVGELAREHYRAARGFDGAFLAAGEPFDLAAITATRRDQVAILEDGGIELAYTHFSVVMNRQRRLAMLTACNIDGGSPQPIKRDRDRWYYDPRLPHAWQSGPDLYSHNPLDRGHLVRRQDPNWGPIDVAERANEDTFHFTNCAPQHAYFNQRLWLELESFILETADLSDQHVSVFTGPVFRADDLLYRGEFALPADFWKVVAFTDRRKGLRATGYLRTQKNLIANLDPETPGREFFDDEVKVYQVPVLQIEALTGLVFGLPAGTDPLEAAGADRTLETVSRQVRRLAAGRDMAL